MLKRKYIELPPIECIQRKAEKLFITEKEIKKTNKNGMGNQVGTITNYVTSMMEVQSHFEKNSDEYRELEYRIECGQLYQQEEIDKLKGITTSPMPNYWYNMGACGDDRYLQSLCAYRKPYFMIYVYDEVKAKYKAYIKASEIKCRKNFSCSIKELYSNYENLNEQQKNFLFWYEFKMPVGTGDCAMNRICKYVEQQMDGYKSQLKQSSTFDYNKLKTKRRCTEEHRQALIDLEKYYCDCIREYKAKNENLDNFEKKKKRIYMIEKFQELSKEACPNDEERLNIILDITYAYDGNKQFCWDCVGELLIERLKEMERDKDSIYTE